MHVDRRRRLLHRPADVDVVVAVEAGVDPALEAHLGGALVDRLDHPALDLVDAEQVGIAPQVQRQRPLGEGAEAALEGADVRVVDVAVGDPGDDVAHLVAPELVGHLGDGRHLGAPGPEQGHDLGDVDGLAHEHAGQHLAHGAAGGGRGRQQTGRRGLGTRVPGHVVAPQALGVAAVEDREAHRRVEPALRREHELGIGGEAGCEDEALRLGDGQQAVEVGPGALGVDVVGGEGRDAAPVVDPGVEQHAEVVGEVGRALDVDVGRKHEAGGGHAP